MRKIDLIVIHCSASDNPDQDSIEAITMLHTEDKSIPVRWGKYKTKGKGFSDIGYHYVITRDGIIHEGRSVAKAGAHVRGHNSHSIGICLTGENIFTKSQFRSLRALLKALLAEFDLDPVHVVLHNQLDSNKTCPNFTLNQVWDTDKEK